MARNFTLSFPARQFLPARGLLSGAAIVSKTCSASYRPLYAFDDSTVEAICSDPVVFPDEYTGSGTLKATVLFSAAGSTGTAAWGISVEAITPNADTLNITSADSFDTANTGTKALSGSTAGDERSAAVTLSNKDSVASGDGVRLAIKRDTVGSDDASGDLFFYVVELFEET